MVYKENRDLSKIQKERRKELRVYLRVFKMKVETSKDVFFGYAKNISASGLFVPTVNPKKVGERFKLKFRLPGSMKDIVVTAEVVWSRLYSDSDEYEPGMGIRFAEISEEDAESIRQFVNSDLSKER
ncbi:MAG: TIGR02266 family protein [Deltaproteobacteria bacterium]|nr:TIGR02266 family protein [Deltaproteobacteria bacterium]